MKTSYVKDVKKLAVLRANELGDYIAVIPALQALKSAYPEAELVFLTKPWTKDYLRQRPGPVDRVVTVPVSRGVRIETDRQQSTPELMDFFEHMQQERFDVAIQLHGGGRYSNSFINNMGARLTVGSRTPDAEQLDRSIPYMLFQNEVLRYLEIVSLIGVPPVSMAPVISVLDSDYRDTKKQLGGLKPPYVVLHPGASDPLRRWDPGNFALVGDQLAEKGFNIVITGTNSEKKLIESVVSRMKATPVNACGALTLNGLTGLLAHASLLISNDTGPLHLGQAVGTKTIGIFWAFNLINWGPTRSYGNYLAVSWITHCPVCGKHLISNYNKRMSFPVCEHDFSLTAQVQPQEVFFYASELLGR